VRQRKELRAGSTIGWGPRTEEAVLYHARLWHHLPTWHTGPAAAGARPTGSFNTHLGGIGVARAWSIPGSLAGLFGTPAQNDLASCLLIAENGGHAARRLLESATRGAVPASTHPVWNIAGLREFDSRILPCDYGTARARRPSFGGVLILPRKGPLRLSNPGPNGRGAGMLSPSFPLGDGNPGWDGQARRAGTCARRRGPDYLRRCGDTEKSPPISLPKGQGRLAAFCLYSGPASGSAPTWATRSGSAGPFGGQGPLPFKTQSGSRATSWAHSPRRRRPRPLTVEEGVISHHLDSPDQPATSAHPLPTHGPRREEKKGRPSPGSKNRGKASPEIHEGAQTFDPGPRTVSMASVYNLAGTREFKGTKERVFPAPI